MSHNKNSFLSFLNALFALTLLQPQQIFAEEEKAKNENIDDIEDDDVDLLLDEVVVEKKKEEVKHVNYLENLSEDLVIGGNVKSVFGFEGIPTSNMPFISTMSRPLSFKALGNSQFGFDAGLLANLNISKTFKAKNGLNVGKIILGAKIEKINNELFNRKERVFELSKATGIFFDIFRVGYDEECVTGENGMLLGVNWKFNKMFSLSFDIMRDLSLVDAEQDFLKGKMIDKKDDNGKVMEKDGKIPETEYKYQNIIPSMGVKGQVNFDLGSFYLGVLLRPILLEKLSKEKFEKRELEFGFAAKTGTSLSFLGRGKDKLDFNVLYTHGAGDYSPKFSKFSDNSKRICDKLVKFPASLALDKNNNKIIVSDFMEFNLGYSIKPISCIETSLNIGDIWNAAAFNEIAKKVLTTDDVYISNIITGKLGVKYFLSKKVEIPFEFNMVYFFFNDKDKLSKKLEKQSMDIVKEYKDKFSSYGWQALIGVDFKF